MKYKVLVRLYGTALYSQQTKTGKTPPYTLTIQLV